MLFLLMRQNSPLRLALTERASVAATENPEGIGTDLVPADVTRYPGECRCIHCTVSEFTGPVMEAEPSVGKLPVSAVQYLT